LAKVQRDRLVKLRKEQGLASAVNLARPFIMSFQGRPAFKLDCYHQHGVLFGMTDAGKSVIIADLLAQIGHRFGFRLIVEEGLSHAVLTQTQGCEPVIINPKIFRKLKSG
jgi:hypothetical protein